MSEYTDLWECKWNSIKVKNEGEAGWALLQVTAHWYFDYSLDIYKEVSLPKWAYYRSGCSILDDRWDDQTIFTNTYLNLPQLFGRWVTENKKISHRQGLAITKGSWYLPDPPTSTLRIAIRLHRSHWKNLPKSTSTCFSL